MERTKDPSDPNEGKLLWRKTAGTFRLPDRRIIRAGDTFWASLEEIPVSFRDTIVAVDQGEYDIVTGAVPAEKIEAVKLTYTKQKREEGNWWDILDGQGKIINEKALREDQADDYLKSLLG